MTRQHIVFAAALTLTLPACSGDTEEGQDAGGWEFTDVGQDAGSDEDLGAEPDLTQDEGPIPSCPVASVSGPGAATVGDSVELDGSGSEDPDGGDIARYDWSLVGVPDGSGAALAPLDDGARVRFVPDVAGDYVVELSVLDDEGVDSCESARATVRVERAADPALVEVKLTWRAMGGVDLDLHYLLPMGRWNEAGDIYWENTTADFGADGTEDDPVLAREDGSGMQGGELVEHLNPAPGAYEIGVYYRDDPDGVGPADATLEYLVGGERLFVLEDRNLLEAGVFWDAFVITWPDRGVIPIDSIMAGFP